MLTRDEIDGLRRESAAWLADYGRLSSSYAGPTNASRVDVVNNKVDGISARIIENKLYNYDRRFFLFRWLQRLFTPIEKQRNLLCFLTAQRLLDPSLSLQERIDAQRILTHHTPRLTSAYLRSRVSSLLTRMNRIITRLTLSNVAERVCSAGKDGLSPHRIPSPSTEQMLQFSAVLQPIPLSASRKALRTRRQTILRDPSGFFDAIYTTFTFAETDDPVSQHQLHLDQIQQLSDRLAEALWCLQQAGKDKVYKHLARECFNHYLYPLIYSYMTYYVGHPEERRNVQSMINAIRDASSKMADIASDITENIFSCCQEDNGDVSDSTPLLSASYSTAAAAATAAAVGPNADGDGNANLSLHEAAEPSAAAYRGAGLDPLAYATPSASSGHARPISASSRQRLVANAAVSKHAHHIRAMPIEVPANAEEIERFKQQFIDGIDELVTRWQGVEQELKRRRGDTSAESYYKQEQAASRKEYMRLGLIHHPDHAGVKFGNQLTGAMFGALTDLYQTTRSHWERAFTGNDIDPERRDVEMQALREALDRLIQLIKIVEAQQDRISNGIEMIRLRDEALDKALAQLDAQIAQVETELVAQRADAEAMQAKQAETDAKQAETDAKQAETDAKQAETDAKLAETDAKLAETDAKQAAQNADLAMIKDLLLTAPAAALPSANAPAANMLVDAAAEPSAAAYRGAGLDPLAYATPSASSGHARPISASSRQRLVANAAVSKHAHHIRAMPIEVPANAEEIERFKQQFIDGIDELVTRWQGVEQELKRRRGDTSAESYYKQEQAASRKEYMRLGLIHHPDHAGVKFGNQLTGAMFGALTDLYQTTRSHWERAFTGNDIDPERRDVEMQALREALDRLIQLIKIVEAQQDRISDGIEMIRLRDEALDKALAQLDAQIAQVETELVAQRADAEAMQAKLAETDAKLAETDAKLAETDAKLAETDAKLAETDAKQAETDAKQAETDAKLAETDAKQAETDAKQAAQDADLAMIKDLLLTAPAAALPSANVPAANMLVDAAAEPSAAAYRGAGLDPLAYATPSASSGHARPISASSRQRLVANAAVSKHAHHIRAMPIEVPANAEEIERFKQQFIDGIDELVTRWQGVEQELKRRRGDTSAESYYKQEQAASRKEYMRLGLIHHPDHAGVKFGNQLTGAMFGALTDLYQTTRSHWERAFTGNDIDPERRDVEMQALREALDRLIQLIKIVEAQQDRISDGIEMIRLRDEALDRALAQLGAQITQVETELVAQRADAEAMQAKQAAQDAKLAETYVKLAETDAKQAAQDADLAMIKDLLLKRNTAPAAALPSANAPAADTFSNAAAEPTASATTVSVSPERREYDARLFGSSTATSAASSLPSAKPPQPKGLH